MIELKTGMVPLTTIQLDSTDHQQLQQELQRRKSEAPALFDGLPCLLSLSNMSEQALASADLGALVELLRQHGLAVVGVRGCPEHLTEACQQLSLVDFGLSTNSRAKRAEQAPEANSAATVEEAVVTVKGIRVYEGNVRSGQQVFFDGDLFIIGMVSPGAEVLATGHIHVLGALRGKALAGVKGSPDATVSCSRFDAQLVAIAGQYQLFEDEHALMNQPALITLENDQLILRGTEK